jgi:predicted lipid-binding transport protein (Tim44 family)
MRALLSQAITSARPSIDGAWLPGLPHVLAGGATWLVFGGAACVAGLLMASLVSFVVWLPLTALVLNHGKPLAADAAAPALTPNAKRALFVLWTATTWLAAAIAR